MKRRSLYQVLVTCKGTGEVRGGDVGDLKEARATVKHFRDHGHQAHIYKWNTDDQRYIRMK